MSDSNQIRKLMQQKTSGLSAKEKVKLLKKKQQTTQAAPSSTSTSSSSKSSIVKSTSTSSSAPAVSVLGIKSKEPEQEIVYNDSLFSTYKNQMPVKAEVKPKTETELENDLSQFLKEVEVAEIEGEIQANEEAEKIDEDDTLTFDEDMQNFTYMAKLANLYQKTHQLESSVSSSSISSSIEKFLQETSSISPLDYGGEEDDPLKDIEKNYKLFMNKRKQDGEEEKENLRSIKKLKEDLQNIIKDNEKNEENKQEFNENDEEFSPLDFLDL